MQDLISIAETFGLPVALLAVMIWFFIRADTRAHLERNEHKEERKEWKESSERMQDKTIAALNELTDAIRKSKL